mgnify:FL=1
MRTLSEADQWKSDLAHDFIKFLERVSGLRFNEDEHSIMHDEFYSVIEKHTKEQVE